MQTTVQPGNKDIVSKHSAANSVARYCFLLIAVLIVSVLFASWTSSETKANITDFFNQQSEDQKQPDNLSTENTIDSPQLDFQSSQDTILNFFGVVHPGKNSVITAPFKGTVIAVNSAVLGSVVKQGELIATLDSQNVRSAIKQADIESRKAEIEYQKLLSWNSNQRMTTAQRELNTAKQRLATAKRDTELTRELLADGIIPANELDAKKDNQQSLENSLETAIDSYNGVLEEGNADRLNFAKQQFELAQEFVNTLRKSFANRELRAPHDGILLPVGKSVELKVGQSIDEGSAIILIGAADIVQIKTTVSELDVSRLSQGTVVSVKSVSFGDRDIPGTITSISNYTSNFQLGAQATNYYDNRPPRISVVVEVDARKHGIESLTRMGMSVQISVLLDDD